MAKKHDSDSTALGMLKILLLTSSAIMFAIVIFICLAYEFKGKWVLLTLICLQLVISLVFTLFLFLKIDLSQSFFSKKNRIYFIAFLILELILLNPINFIYGIYVYFKIDFSIRSQLL